MINRVQWLCAVLVSLCSALALAKEVGRFDNTRPDTALTRIAFGSCADEGQAQPIWDAVNATRPQLFIFLGDNVYLDTQDPDEMRQKYRRLARQPGFKRLRAQTPLVAIWDDHDYGEGDAGAEFPAKEATRQAFLKFWNEPKHSPRWTQPGIYTSYLFGPNGQRVQVILPDLRWNRTPLFIDPRWGDYDH